MTDFQAISYRGRFKTGGFRLSLAFALLNAPYWWLSHTEFLTRPWFNVDLLLPLVVAPVSLAWSAVALGALWVLDLAVSQSLTWHFHSPFEFIRSIEFLPSVHLTGYLSTSSFIRAAVFMVCGASALWMAKQTRRASRAAVVVLVALALIDVLNGSSFLWVRAARPLPGNVAGSAVKTTVASMLSPLGAQLQPLPEHTSLTAKFGVLDFAASHPDRSILLVIVESMGLHDDPIMREALRHRLVDRDVESRFDVVDFTVPFQGATVDGELRELCGIDGNYRALGQFNPRCLPAQLTALGWKTVGLHGFSKRMFMRGLWWPKIGLQQGLFAENMALPDQPRCGGAFVGICDAEVIRRAVAETRAPKHFVYAMTLNSHLPLETVPLSPDLKRICDRADSGTDVCALTSVVGTALNALREAIAREPHPPLVLVVGDHAPPFSQLSSRRQFSQTAVPGFALVPKD